MGSPAKRAMSLSESWRSAEEIDGEARVCSPRIETPNMADERGVFGGGHWWPSPSITDADLPLVLICAS